ncbi:MAG: hypothetical protein RQ982_06895 [Gammaproteobacteria bacterium]|nr:hypothetical protein [Gammaproteobacteria bacterium]
MSRQFGAVYGLVVILAIAVSGYACSARYGDDTPSMTHTIIDLPIYDVSQPSYGELVGDQAVNDVK